MPTTNKPLLTEEQRTVTFTMEEAKVIYNILGGFHPESATESLESIAQFVMQNMCDATVNLGDDFFTLRQLRDFYAGLRARLDPVYEAYNALPVDVKWGKS